MVPRDTAGRLEALQAVLHALAHPSRRQILMVVWFRGGSMGSGDIAKRFHHAWPTISRHLGVLVESGLLAVSRAGRARIYSVDEERLDLLREWLAWFQRPDPDDPEAG